MRRYAPLVLLLLAGCDRPAPRPVPPRSFEPTPTRGVLLLSIDTLRADHLGAYGYARPTSPFFDRLASRGTLFERVYSQYPGTLQSHMTIFTGLYPDEHDVLPPALVLSPRIPTLPEHFSRAGFRTSGHTEGGWMAGGFGFQRGFDDWSDEAYAADTDVRRTFDKGLAFLRALPADQRFFVFLHTYSVHDPYRPPPEWVARFWPGPPPPGALAPDGPEFGRRNREKLPTSSAELDYLRALYDASIAYVDSELERLWGELERSGLADQLTLVITSDHGEEFGEHGRLAHTQVYDECLHVPLLVVHPAQRSGTRASSLVELVDLAPTLLELEKVPATGMSGRSFLPLLRDPTLAHRPSAFAEVRASLGIGARALFVAEERKLWELVHTRPEPEGDGVWVTKSVAFDGRGPRLDFQAVAFQSPRTVEVRIDGRTSASLELVSDWRPFALELPADGAPHRVTLGTPGCVSPAEVGLDRSDGRCLSFKLRGLGLDRLELFDLEADRAGQEDLSRRDAARARELALELKGIRHQPRARAGSAVLEDEQTRQLRALGYLQ